MSDRKYTIALTHAILAGTSMWVIYRVNGLHYATGSFAVICTNSIVGLWKYGNPEHGDKVNSIFEITNLCVALFAIPGVCADLYLHYGYDKIYPLLHVALPIVSITMYAMNNENADSAIVDFSNFANTLSMGAICFNFDNYFGIYAAISYAFNHFIFKKKEIRDVPKEVVYNLGMCFYTYFAYRSLSDAFVIGVYSLAIL